MDSKKQSRRILITGGTGFIGAHLARRLSATGHDVHVVHRAHSDLRRLHGLGVAAKLWVCDFLDSKAIASLFEAVRPHVIYHLAGDSTLRHLDPELKGVTDSIERNVCPTLNLIVAAQANRGDLELFVRVGGLEEYGHGALPYDEAQREQPVSPYSASQVAVTHYMQMLSPHLGFRTLTVRPALIYGPAQSTRFFVPALIEACQQGRDFRISTGSQGRDLLYVEDLIDAFVRLLTAEVKTGEIINIGAGREYIMSEVAALVVRLTGAKIRLIEEGAARPGQIEHLYCSVQKAKSLLGWQPAISLEEGLRRTIASLRPVL